jgi:NTP pyrophosphatase (non-canonical NTP hydrolase)
MNDESSSPTDEVNLPSDETKSPVSDGKQSFPSDKQSFPSDKQSFPSDKKVTIQQLKDEYAIFVKERNWNKYHDPKSVAASISIEANELLELFQWDTLESANNKIYDPKWREKIESEVADVFIYLIIFANQTDIDLAKVFEEKMKKVREKFKIEHQDNLEAYYRVKEEYRKKRK